MRIVTDWDVRTYDVWGNAKDGYEVNDTYSRGSVTLHCKVEHHNVGTEQAFNSASPSDYQLGRIFGTRAKLDVDGDDLTLYVNRASDGYPLGELHCTSHESLSPIRVGKR